MEPEKIYDAESISTFEGGFYDRLRFCFNVMFKLKVKHKIDVHMNEKSFQNLVERIAQKLQTPPPNQDQGKERRAGNEES